MSMTNIPTFNFNDYTFPLSTAENVKIKNLNEKVVELEESIVILKAVIKADNLLFSKLKKNKNNNFTSGKT